MELGLYSSRHCPTLSASGRWGQVPSARHGPGQRGSTLTLSAVCMQQVLGSRTKVPQGTLPVWDELRVSDLTGVTATLRQHSVS